MKDPVGPFDCVEKLKQSLIIIENRLIKLAEQEDPDPAELKYLQEFRQHITSIHNMTTTIKEAADIKKVYLMSTMFDALKNATPGEKQSLIVSIEKQIEKSEEQCQLPG